MSREIRTNKVLINETPTISTDIYASGDLIGTKVIFDGGLIGTKGYIQTIRLTDLAKQDASIDVYLFSADPDGTTFTDNAELDIVDADLSKVMGVVTMDTYFDTADNSIAFARNLAIPFESTSTILYGVLVSRGTPTYASVADINIQLGIVL